MPKKTKYKNLLLIGGAGYIGSSMMRDYIKNKNITGINCLDKLIYSNQTIDKKIFKIKKYKFFNGDFRDRKILDRSLKKVTDVVILAGLVGDPITKKYKSLGYDINLRAIKKLINHLSNQKNIRKVLFISTCSNYGIVKNKIADEKTKLSPKSSYAIAKVEIEKFLLKKKKSFCSVILRFSTAFGLSPRMRYDLTVNEFCKYAHEGDNLVVYDAETWRPYCHVKDFSRIVLKVLMSPDHIVNNQVFNVGSNKLNYRKRDIVKFIKKHKKKLKVTYLKKKIDPRNYRVNFKKLEKVLKIKPIFSAEYGIKEIVKNLTMNKKVSLDIGNYKIKNSVK